MKALPRLGFKDLKNENCKPPPNKLKRQEEGRSITTLILRCVHGGWARAQPRQPAELPALLLHFHCSQCRQGCAHSDGNQRHWRVTAHGNHSYELTEHAEENNRPSMHACKKKERLNPASLDPISSHYLSEISLLLARLLTCIMTTYVIKGTAR